MKKKILFVISSLSFGGAEKQTIALLNKIDKNKFIISLAYLDNAKNLLSEITGDLSNIICLEKNSKFDVFIITKLAKVIKKIQPDVIVCVNPYPLFCVKSSLLFVNCRSKIIIVLHSTRMRSRYNRMIVKNFYRHLINRSDKIVFVCKNQMGFWIDYQGINEKKSTVIYNGIDSDHFSQATYSDSLKLRQRLGFNKDDFVIVICATFRKEKQHSVLINAISLIREKKIPAKLLIVGDGGEKESILRSIHMVKMEKHTKLVGFQQDVRPYISAADVFALVSSTETFSMAILEAMSLGKAIVASKTGGTPEQIEDRINGFLFQPGNKNELAQKMCKIYFNNMQKEMGKVSKKKVKNHFSERIMIERYENLFTGI